MFNQNNGLCQLFKKMPTGTVVNAQFKDGNNLLFIFINRVDDCITGLISEGYITLSCKKIIALFCFNTPPNININALEFSNDVGLITGQVSYGGVLLSNFPIHLFCSSKSVHIQSPVITNNKGIFTSNVKISDELKDSNIDILFQTYINDTLIRGLNSVTLNINKTPTLSLCSPDEIRCNGIVSGRLSCESTPLSLVSITFTLSPKNTNITITPNPTLTNDSGEFYTEINVTKNVLGTYTLSASSTLGSSNTSISKEISIKCTGCCTSHPIKYIGSLITCPIKKIIKMIKKTK